MDPVIDPVADRLHDLAARWFREQRVPGLAVGVVRDGALAWTGSYGYADRASGRPVGPGTPFRIASITKSFTATAILQLRDDGRLRLDDPLVAHVPEAGAITNPFGPIEEVTIRRLLTHAAGLPIGSIPGGDPWQVHDLGEDEVLAALGRLTLPGRVDSGWRYSNLGYELLGAVVSRLSGDSFAGYVQRAILGPAGLSSTTFEPGGELAERAATGYRPGRFDDDLSVAPPYDPAAIQPDAGLWSTVEDLARWLTLHSRIGDDDRRGEDGRVLDGRTLREMQRPAVLANDEWTYAQGFGWGTIRLADVSWLGHTGSLNGFRAIVRFRAADKLGVVALVNGAVRPNPLAHEIATIVLEAHRAATPAVPQSAPASTPPSWREVLGIYREDDYGFGVRFEARDGKLVMVNEEDPSDRSTLVAAAGHDPDGLVFTMVDGDGAGEPVTFLRNGAGRIAAVNVSGIPLQRLDYVER